VTLSLGRETASLIGILLVLLLTAAGVTVAGIAIGAVVLSVVIAVLVLTVVAVAVGGLLIGAAPATTTGLLIGAPGTTAGTVPEAEVAARVSTALGEVIALLLVLVPVLSAAAGLLPAAAT
jgi:hypothetical protein